MNSSRVNVKGYGRKNKFRTVSWRVRESTGDEVDAG